MGRSWGTHSAIVAVASAITLSSQRSAFAQTATPSASSDGQPTRATATEPDEPESPTPELQRLRAQPRIHATVGALGEIGSLVSNGRVPGFAGALALDLGVQIRDEFAVFATARVMPLIFVNRLRLGAAFEWSAYDFVSLGIGATADVSHEKGTLGPDVWTFGASVPFTMLFDVPTPPRAHVARDCFRLWFELRPSIESPISGGTWWLWFGFGLGYARR